MNTNLKNPTLISLAFAALALASCQTAETAATGSARTVGNAAQGVGRTVGTSVVPACFKYGEAESLTAESLKNPTSKMILSSPNPHREESTEPERSGDGRRQSFFNDQPQYRGGLGLKHIDSTAENAENAKIAKKRISLCSLCSLRLNFTICVAQASLESV